MCQINHQLDQFEFESKWRGCFLTFSLCLPHCNVQSHRKLSKCFALLMLILVVDLFKFISLNSAGDANCDFVSELFLYIFFIA